MAKDTKTKATKAAAPAPKGPAPKAGNTVKAAGAQARTVGPGGGVPKSQQTKPSARAESESEQEDTRPMLHFRLRADAGRHVDRRRGIDVKAGGEVFHQDELDVHFPGKFDRLAGATSAKPVARPNPASPSFETGEGPQAPAVTDDTASAVRGKHKTKSVPPEEEADEELEGEAASSGENLPEEEADEDEVADHVRSSGGTSDDDEESDEDESEEEDEEDESEDVTEQFKKAQEGELTVKKDPDGSYSIWEGDDAPEKKGLKTKAAVNDALKKMVK